MLVKTAAVSLNYRDKAGLFVRADGLYDFEIMDNQEGRRIPLNHDAKNLVGSYTRLLDAFGFWRFDLGTMPSEIRLGRQVVSWGESTFIQNGLNQVNHFDVAALRVPGAELKEALLPDEMAVLNVQLSKNFSTQLLYLFDWHETRPEPAGSYFSTNDFGSPGGERVFLGFGAFSDLGVDFRPLGGPYISDFQAVNRLPDHKPRDAGQYGVKFKLNLPNTCATCHSNPGLTKEYQMKFPEAAAQYMDSIHGEGLFKRGLTVTAVCTSCHTAHFVLPHTDPRSSIAKQNISKTCTHCHGQIETVHRKVIRGELWQKDPGAIPACVDCHQPHRRRAGVRPRRERQDRVRDDPDHRAAAAAGGGGAGAFSGDQAGAWSGDRERVLL